MHIADTSKGNLGANGIVGGGIPIATGAGLTARQLGTDQVAVSFFGDGAANQGTFHESLNLAAIWKLPVVYICENNQYAESLPAAKGFATDDIASRAIGYGMPGVNVDGRDVRLVYAAAGKAIARARAGGGPTLIVAEAYRHEGHYYGDPQQYRTKEEIEAWRTTFEPDHQRSRLADLGRAGDRGGDRCHRPRGGRRDGGRDRLGRDRPDRLADHAGGDLCQLLKRPPPGLPA